jgi:hypothetical protein
MSGFIPENHPLRRLFLAALDKAFIEFQELYSPGVASHLSEEVLCDFIHVDRLYRLRNTEGRRLEELPAMLQVSSSREGPERRIEVDSYIGDFTLFLGGFFPASVHRNRWFTPNPMVSKVGQIFVSFQQPLDYYAAEGRNAYRRAAETARLFAPEERDTYTSLSENFDRFTVLLRRVKDLISDEPHLRQVEGILD